MVCPVMAAVTSFDGESGGQHGARPGAKPGVPALAATCAPAVWRLYRHTRTRRARQHSPGTARRVARPAQGSQCIRLRSHRPRRGIPGSPQPTYSAWRRRHAHRARTGHGGTEPPRPGGIAWPPAATISPATCLARPWSPPVPSALPRQDRFCLSPAREDGQPPCHPRSSEMAAGHSGRCGSTCTRMSSRSDQAWPMSFSIARSLARNECSCPSSVSRVNPSKSPNRS
jgi:hypothetical protein